MMLVNQTYLTRHRLNRLNWYNFVLYTLGLVEADANIGASIRIRNATFSPQCIDWVIGLTQLRSSRLLPALQQRFSQTTGLTSKLYPKQPNSPSDVLRWDGHFKVRRLLEIWRKESPMLFYGQKLCNVLILDALEKHTHHADVAIALVYSLNKNHSSEPDKTHKNKRPQSVITAYYGLPAEETCRAKTVLQLIDKEYQSYQNHIQRHVFDMNPWRRVGFMDGDGSQINETLHFGVHRNGLPYVRISPVFRIIVETEARLHLDVLVRSYGFKGVTRDVKPGYLSYKAKSAHDVALARQFHTRYPPIHSNRRRQFGLILWGHYINQQYGDGRNPKACFEALKRYLHFDFQVAEESGTVKRRKHTLSELVSKAEACLLPHV